MTAQLECLDIPATSRPRYDAESLMRLPAFWAGAAKARDESEVAAIRRLRAIQDAVAHTPLCEIPDFAVWLAREPRR